MLLFLFNSSLILSSWTSFKFWSRKITRGQESFSLFFREIRACRKHDHSDDVIAAESQQDLGRWRLQQRQGESRGSHQLTQSGTEETSQAQETAVHWKHKGKFSFVPCRIVGTFYAQFNRLCPNIPSSL